MCVWVRLRACYLKNQYTCKYSQHKENLPRLTQGEKMAMKTLGFRTRVTHRNNSNNFFERANCRIGTNRNLGSLP